MQLWNTQNHYGSISKFLHWTIALLVLIQLATVFWVQFVLPEKSPQAGFFIGDIHKPVGVLVLVLAILAIAWRMMNIKPAFPSTMPRWEKVTAQLVHRLLYLGIILMPISGLIMTEAAGRPPNLFGLYQIPMFMTENKSLASLFFEIHSVIGFCLIALVVLHTLAALKHHFIDKDSVLKRMLP